MVILKGSTEADTMMHITSDKLFDVFGKSRFRDTGRLDQRFSYNHNIHGTFTAYSLVTKAWVDSLLGTLGGGGITSINSQTGPTITLDEGTAGTDFSITQSTNTIFFNLPSSSASNRGLLTATDWSTFNNKLSNITGLVSQGTNVTITGTGTSGDPYVINSSGGGGGGDFSSNTATSVDNEIVLFSGTGGKTGKRATQTGLLLGTSGVLSATTTSAGISSAISDETGTGVAVFGTNPTLTAATMAGNLTNNSAGAYDIGATGTRFRYIFANGLNINSSGAGAANTINVIPGFTVTNGTTPAATGTNHIFTFSSAASAATSGTTNFILWGTSGFAPTSGTAVFNQHRFAHTINQTGGANGITRTLFIDPTITAAADYRAIENTVGNNIFNSTSGNTGIGISPTQKLHVAGNGLFTGSVTVADAAYDATTWNGSAEVPTKNAVRDKIESILASYEMPFSDITTTTIANTTTETTLYGTGVGTAAYSNITAGSSLVLQGYGRLSSGGSPTAPTLECTIGTLTIGIVLSSFDATLTNAAYRYKFEIIPKATGTSQDVFYNITFEVMNLAGTGWRVFSSSSEQAGGFTTTGSPAADVTWTWGNADASNSITAYKNTVEIFRK
jgi:hypothetical protein